MSLIDEVKKLRSEATTDNQIEKIWEAIEIVAKGADSTEGAADNLRRDMRLSGL